MAEQELFNAWNTEIYLEAQTDYQHMQQQHMQHMTVNASIEIDFLSSTLGRIVI